MNTHFLHFTTGRDHNFPHHLVFSYFTLQFNGLPEKTHFLIQKPPISAVFCCFF